MSVLIAAAHGDLFALAVVGGVAAATVSLSISTEETS